ncbi:MAG: DUF2786 domain-containing protein, partial [Candidatus Micrarchaeota archaeon]
MDRDQVLDTVEKLLKLAGGTDFEAEAAAAMAKAHELLLKHGLEMADVGNGQGQEDVVHLTYEMPDLCWRQCYVTLSRHNFCRVVVAPYKQPPECYIIGRPTNVKAVAAMAAKIMVQLEAMAWVEAQMANSNRRGFRVPFVCGALSRLHHRLLAETQKVQQATAGSQALVVCYDEENRDYERRVWPSLGYAKKISINNMGAWT